MTVNEAHTQTTEPGRASAVQLPERATTPCSCDFLCLFVCLRITNPKEGHVSSILPKADWTKYHFNWFELTTLTVLN